MGPVLCEKCFPDWGICEIHTIVPIRPCEECGRSDNRMEGEVRCHLFARDPRVKAMIDVHQSE